MSFVSAASLLLALAQPAIPGGCEEDAPVRDPKVCKPLYSEGDFTIYSMESVAVGTGEEMMRVRQMTRHCGLANRIDGVGGVDLAVYDIFDATKESRECVRSAIARQAPELVFTQERFDALFQTAPPLPDKPRR